MDDQSFIESLGQIDVILKCSPLNVWGRVIAEEVKSALPHCDTPLVREQLLDNLPGRLGPLIGAVRMYSGGESQVESLGQLPSAKTRRRFYPDAHDLIDGLRARPLYNGGRVIVLFTEMEMTMRVDPHF